MGLTKDLKVGVAVRGYHSGRMIYIMRRRRRRRRKGGRWLKLGFLRGKGIVRKAMELVEMLRRQRGWGRGEEWWVGVRVRVRVRVRKGGRNREGTNGAGHNRSSEGGARMS
jgi:hypothetical protein